MRAKQLQRWSLTDRVRLALGELRREVRYGTVTGKPWLQGELSVNLTDGQFAGDPDDDTDGFAAPERFGVRFNRLLWRLTRVGGDDATLTDLFFFARPVGDLSPNGGWAKVVGGNGAAALAEPLFVKTNQAVIVTTTFATACDRVAINGQTATAVAGTWKVQAWAIRG